MTANAETSSSKWRAYVRIAGLAGLFLAYLPPHLLSKWLLGGSPWPPRFLAAAARISGARVRVEGKPLAPHTLAIANHTSWLDIDRAERADAHGQVRRISDRLSQSQPLTVFPEGTTGDGKALLHFRSTLLDAVAPPLFPGISVRPVAIDYGAQRAAIGWSGGEAGKANVLKILGRRGSFKVVVRLLPPLPPHDDRKALARTARSAIEAALTASTRAELGL